MSNEYWQSIALGIVQGIAEFLPISSSGHLVILGELWFKDVTAADQKLDLNIALHLGSLFSIALVYRKILLKTLLNLKMMQAIVIATIPIVIVGLTLKDKIEAAFDSPLIAGFGLLATALFLSVSHVMSTRYTRKEPLGDVNSEEAAPSYLQSLVVGLFQAIAITPGISRSGSTISGALIMGMEKVKAAQFSFLIAIPAIAGATLLKSKDMLETTGGEKLAVGVLATGMLVSFVVGYFSLTALIRIIARGKLYYFAIYCFFAGLVTILWQWNAPGV